MLRLEDGFTIQRGVGGELAGSVNWRTVCRAGLQNGASMRTHLPSDARARSPDNQPSADLLLFGGLEEGVVAGNLLHQAVA